MTHSDMYVLVDAGHPIALCDGVRYMLEHFVNVCVPPPCGGDNRKKTYDY